MKRYSLKEDGRPAIMWYWADWFSSFDVRACSLAARGLWVDMLGIMARSEVKGALIMNGEQLDSKSLANITGATAEEIDVLLKELGARGVFSKLLDGTIINRRMYSERNLSEKRSVAGKAGADARWQASSKDYAKPLASVEDEDEVNLKEGEDKSLRKDGGGDTDIKLVQLLIDLMIENNPESSIIKRLTPERQKEWICQCRLLRERDEKKPDQIEKVIRFSQSDNFWKTNILSFPKLREKWDQLWMKAKKGDHLQGIKDFLNDK